METLKASTPGLARIKQARKEKGWSVDNPKWLEEASRVLGINWDEAGYLAEGISEGTWKRFLAGKRPIKAEAFKAYSEVLGLNWKEISDRASVQDWGEAPESSVFYGRSEELTTLTQWIINDRCRLVTLLGMGGIGKTALAVKLAESIQEQFQSVIWRSLRYVPPVEDILAELIGFLWEQNPSLAKGRKEEVLSAGFNARLSLLIDGLRKYRCLLVLDNFEAVLWDGESHPETLRHRTGSYLEGYEGYSEFLKRVGESPHQSAIILISREKPREIAAIEGKSLPIRSLQLNGLPEIEAREILKAKGLAGEEEWETLIKLYRGNPLALNIVSTTIQDLFNNNVPEFLKQNTLVITGLTDILDQQFKRLSVLEKQIMYWLAIHCHPVLLSQLQSDILFPVKTSKLIEVLQSLGWRSIIEKSTEPSEVLFTLPPVVMKYVTNHFVEQVCEQLCEDELELICSHALVCSQYSNSNLQEFQFKPILTSVKEQLALSFRSEKRVREHLRNLLSILEGKPTLDVGYAQDNLLKLLAELESGC
ncbi:AAA family ATPase [Allocoleopsis sp.]|uniref:AAA family ATPase n=1 Tax=Allocoleopsis sp. TaxID=3088169 RepID=UPI002FD50882